MEGERVMTKQLLEIAEPRAWPTFRMLRVLYSHLVHVRPNSMFEGPGLCISMSHEVQASHKECPIPIRRPKPKLRAARTRGPRKNLLKLV
jgi:hypothetical protein